ncbi:MAG: hypothetical protein DRG27_00700 [Deltaproteobacteria bacterium]|nr:MAG: hypothetical protein DRG27_00700 [Deltaproteobacteria bacterium]
MNTEELATLMKQVEEKGLDWSEVEKKIEVPKQLLDLYVKSGPVPVTLIKKLKQVIEEASQN